MAKCKYFANISSKLYHYGYILGVSIRQKNIVFVTHLGVFLVIYEEKMLEHLGYARFLRNFEIFRVKQVVIKRGKFPSPL